MSHPSRDLSCFLTRVLWTKKALTLLGVISPYPKSERNLSGREVEGHCKQSGVKFKATGARESPGEAPATKTAALYPDCWVRMKQTQVLSN